MTWLVALLAVAAIVPVWKLLGVIVGDGDGLVASGRSQGITEVEIPALRGPILDRSGAELAISLPRVRIAANERILAELAADDPQAEGRFVSLVAEATDVDEGELIDLLSAAAPDDPWVKLVESATPEQADEVKAALKSAKLLDALVVEDTSVRVHPSGDSGLRVIGSLGPDGPGPGAGVERYLDDELRGRAGSKVLQQSPTGEVIAGSEEVTGAPQQGASVTLTLDRNLQYEVERVLMQGAQVAGAAGGIAVLGRPSTGELLAVAGVERDPETGVLGLAESPKAFTEAYQAGSVFKLVPVSAAIEDGVVGLDTALSVPDHIQVWDRTFTDHDPHPTQAMTVQDIVSHSSNVGTIKIAEMLGAERQYQALTDFGFGSTTGIANPAESSGVLPAVQDWNGPDSAASAIGTLQSATAVQLWSAYNVIANDGIYVAPRLVQSVQRADGESYTPERTAKHRVVSETTATQVEAALGAVVTEGTGKRWDLPGFPAAAKTGTSRMPSPESSGGDDGYVWSDGKYHYLNAFTGYLPLQDPQLSITVLLEDVDSGLTGSTGAGPVFSELARLGIRELGIAPTDDASQVRPVGLRAEPATTVPATTVPATTVPATTVPDATVPETSAPGTKTPVTTVAAGTSGSSTRVRSSTGPDG